MNNLKEIYINKIAEAIFNASREFFFTYAPAALTQSANMDRKFSTLSEEEKSIYFLAAKMIVPIVAPKIVVEEKDE